MRTRVTVAAVLGCIVALLLAAPASAQTGYGAGLLVAPGQSVTISGEGCSAGADVVVEFRQGSDSQVLATVSADQDGNFEAVVTIPPSAQPGPAQLVATCGSTVVTTALNVSSGTLPFTGSPDSTGTLVGVGGALVVLGAAAVYGARRRSAAHAAADAG